MSRHGHILLHLTRYLGLVLGLWWQTFLRIHEMGRFYGFVHEIVAANHEMGRFYGFVCLIMLEGCVVGMVKKTVSISMCLSGRRMHVWMLTPRIIRGGEHRKVDSRAYINDFDAQRFYGWEMQIDWGFPLSRYCRRD